MFEGKIDGLASGNFKKLNKLIVGGLDNSQDIRRQRDPLLAHKLKLGTCNLWVGDHLAIVVVDHDAVGVFDEAEIFGTLQNKTDGIFQVEDMGSVPIGKVVDVALVGSSHNEVVIAN